MNLFGLEIKMGKRNNNPDCFVKKEECHLAMEGIQHTIDTRFNELQKHLDNRFEDFKDFLNKK